jgi:hypothetical protein
MPKKQGQQFKAVMPPDKGINQYDPINLINDRAWSDGNNVRFGKGYVEKVGGWAKFLRQPSARAATTAYVVGDYVVPATPNTYVYKCTTAGTTGSGTPTWPTTYEATVTDGTAVWTNVGVNMLNGVLQTIDNFFKYNGDSWLLFITTTKIYRYDPVTKTAIDITGGTLNGDVDNPVFSDTAQNVFVFTNGIDSVKYWNGSGNIANLPGLTDCVPWNDGTPVTLVLCRGLRYFKNFLMLIGTTENGIAYPQRIRWSAIGDIFTWKNNDQPTQDLQAGWADMTDGVDWGQCLEPMGNYLVAYKERSIQVLSYVGGDEIWDKWPAIQGTGLLGSKALMNLGDEHIFIGPDNIYSFDLREVKVAGDDIAKQFLESLNPSTYSQINNFFFEELPEGGFSFVSTASTDGTPDKAIVYNPNTKAWSWRDFPMTCYGYYQMSDDPTWNNADETWDSTDAPWDSSRNLANAPINICGDSNGVIYVLTGHSKDGADIESFVTTKLFDFGNPILMKRAVRLQLMISREGDAYTLPVYVGTAGNVDEDITWSGPYNMNLDVTSPPWVDFDITARYMQFKFGTIQKDQPWKLTGYIVYYHLRGAV